MPDYVVVQPAEDETDDDTLATVGLGIKVFSATKARDREFLGETITDWIRTHPEHEVFDKIVTQSSDAEFHCLAITLFFTYRAAAT